MKLVKKQKKGPKFDGAEKMRDFYHSVIKKPLTEDDKKKLKAVFGKKKEIKVTNKNFGDLLLKSAKQAVEYNKGNLELKTTECIQIKPEEKPKKDKKFNYGLITGLFMGFVGGGFIPMLILVGGYQPNITPQERLSICYEYVIDKYEGRQIVFSAVHDYLNDTTLCTMYIDGKVDGIKVIGQKGNIK